VTSFASELSGTFAAIITPFDSSRVLDEPALEHLIEYLNARERLQGFALCTDAAEDELLSLDERKVLIRLVAQMKGPDLGLIVRISCHASKEAAELAKVAETAGAHAVSVKLPRLPGVGYRELYRHIDQICRAVKIPVLLHTQKGDGLESLQIEEFETLVNYQGLKGVVAPQATTEELLRWKKWFGERDGAILSGCSLAMREATESGACGAVCGVYALAPEAADDISQAVSRGETASCKKLEAKWSAAQQLLGPKLRSEPPAGLQKIAAKIAKRSLEEKVLPTSYAPAAIKAALSLQGHTIRAEVRPPLETLRSNALEKFEAQLRKVGILG